MGNPLGGRIGGEPEVSDGPFVAGVTGFFSTWTHVGRVLAWILVMQMLGAQDMVRVLLRGFLLASIPCSTSPLAGTAAWLGDRGEVGVSDGMVAKVLSFVGRVLHRPWNAVSDKVAVVALSAQRETGWDLGGRAGFNIGFHRLRGDALSPPPVLSVRETQETWWTGERGET